MPKAASTTLQKAVFRKHSDVSYLGKQLAGVHQAYRAGAARLRQSLDPDATQRHPPGACRDDLQRFLEDAARDDRTPVWSQETRTGGTAEHREYCAELFRICFGRARVLIIVREPRRFVQSFYLQTLRGNNVKRHPKPDLHATFGSAPMYFSINEWLEAVWPEPHTRLHGHLRYAETTRIYQKVFGNDNVRVLLFEQLIEPDGKALGEMSDFMQIGADETFALFQREQANPSWSERQVQHLKEREGDAWFRLRFRLGGRRGRESMLRGTHRGVVREPLEEMSPEWSERLAEVAREQNRQLLEVAQLPLARYSYSL